MKKSGRPYFVYPTVVAVSMFYAVLGYMIPVIRGRFSLTLAEAGLLSTLQSIGLAVSVLLCFCVFSALNKPKVMAASVLLFAVSLFVLSSAGSVWLLCVIFFFIGLFANVVDTLSNAVVADLVPDGKDKHIGLLQAIFSAFSAVAPFFALMLGGVYVPVFLGLGVFALLSFAAFTFGLYGEVKRKLFQYPGRLGTVGKMARMLKIKGIRQIVLVSFFAFFVQVSLYYFISSFVESFCSGAFDAALVMCLMFTGSLLGRLLYVKMAGRFTAYRIMVLYNSVALVSLSAMLFTADVTSTGLFAALTGFGFSANFPAMMVRACNLVPEDTSAASALVFMGDICASFAAPPLVGAIGDALGLKTAFAMCAAILLPVIILSARIDKKDKTAQGPYVARKEQL